MPFSQLCNTHPRGTRLFALNLTAEEENFGGVREGHSSAKGEGLNIATLSLLSLRQSTDVWARPPPIRTPQKVWRRASRPILPFSKLTSTLDTSFALTCLGP